MILLDSCAVLDIMLGERDAVVLSNFLDEEQSFGKEIVFLPLMVLESSSVIAVRFKEGRTKDHGLNYYLNILKEFGATTGLGQLTPELISDAARIKSSHGASMVDCYLIASALTYDAEVLTSDNEILKFQPKKSKIRKITKKFSSIHWRP